MRTLAEVDQKLIIATCVCSTSKLNKTTNPGPDCGEKKKKKKFKYLVFIVGKAIKVWTLNYATRHWYSVWNYFGSPKQHMPFYPCNIKKFLDINKYYTCIVS